MPGEIMAGNSLGRLTLDLVARIGQFIGPLDQAERQTRQSAQRMQQSMLGISDGVKTMLSSFAGISAIYSAIDAADKFTGLRNRLILVTDGQAELNRAMSATFDIAQRTGTAWDNAAVVYQRFAQNADALGLSQQRVAAITETVSKAVSLSGASADAANAALTQFGQALASGVLRGEEFNSVMEQTPGLAQAIAKGLGVPIGQLRNLAQTGQITADQLVKALEKVAPEVAKSFDKTAFTIGQSFVQVKDAYTKFIGESNGGSAAALAGTLSTVAKNFDLIANTGAAVGIGYVTKSFAAATIAVTQNVAATLNSIKVEEVAAQQRLRKAQAEYNAAQAEMSKARAAVLAADMQVAADRAVIASEINRLKSTQTQLVAEKQLELQRFQAQINDQGRAASVNRMAALRQTEALIVRELQAAETQLAATTVATSSAYTTARNAQTLSTERLATANLELGLAQKATTASSVGLIGALGGPAGLIGMVAMVGAGMYLMSGHAETAAVSIDELGKSAEDAAKKFRELNNEQQKSTLINIASKIRDEQKEVENGVQRINEVLRTISFTPSVDENAKQRALDMLEQLKAGTITTSEVWQEFKQEATIPQNLKNDLEDQVNRVNDNTEALKKHREIQRGANEEAIRRAQIDQQLAAYSRALTEELDNNKQYYAKLKTAMQDTATAANDPALTKNVQKALADLASGAKGAEERTRALIAAMPVSQDTRDTLTNYLGIVVDSAKAQKIINKDIKDAQLARNGEVTAIDAQTTALQKQKDVIASMKQDTQFLSDQNTFMQKYGFSQEKARMFAQARKDLGIAGTDTPLPDSIKLAIAASLKQKDIQQQIADAEKKATDEKEKQLKLQEKLAKLSDLRIKPGATGAGDVHQGTVQAAKFVQDNFDVRQFTSFNDTLHKNRNSMHNKGLAFDFTLNNVAESKQTVDALTKSLKDAGINAQILDEYLHPSKGATGGHIHVAFKSADDAQKFVTQSMTKRGDKFLEDAVKANESYFKKRNEIASQYDTDREKADKDHGDRLIAIDSAYYDSPELKQQILDREQFRYATEQAGIRERELQAKLEFDRYFLTEEQFIKRDLEVREQGIKARLDLNKGEQEKALAAVRQQADDDIKYSQLQNDQKILDTKTYYAKTIDIMKERYRLEREEIMLTAGKPDTWKQAMLQGVNAKESNDFYGQKDQAWSDYKDAFGADDKSKALQANYDAQLEIIKRNEELRNITVEEAAQRRLQAEKDYNAAKYSLVASSGADIAGSLAASTKTLFGEQSKAYKKMLKVQQAFALAQAIINVPKTASEAYSAMAGIPYVGPVLGVAAAAAAVAAQMANVAAIRGTQLPATGFMSGGYTGDMATNAVAGVVHGQEYVFDAPAVKSIGRDNLDALRSGKLQRSINVAKSASDSAPKIIVNNYAAVDVNTSTDGNVVTMDIVDRRIAQQAPKAVAGDLSNPNGTVAKAMKRQFNVTSNR